MFTAPMFPLSTALLPGEPLPLRIFEPRYQRMLDVCLESDTQRFGVVLIARGSEVGGGEVRVDAGTFAVIDAVDRLPDGRATLACSGADRFRVVEWLPDDPFPQARVEVIPELVFTDADCTRLREVGDRIRALIVEYARAHDVEPGQLEAAFATGDLPAQAVQTLYRWVASLPTGPMDRQRLLEAHDAETALDVLADAADGFAARMAFGS